MASHAWDQQPGETAKAYAAFLAYRNLGSERSLTKLAQASNKSRPLFRRWSVRWNWVERVSSWDTYQHGRQEVVATHALEQATTNWALEREAERARELEFGLALIAKARTMLDWPLAQREVTRDGQTTIIMPTKWRMADAAKYVETGSKLIRLAAEMETDRVTVQVEAARLAAELGIPVDEALAEVEAILAERGTRS